MDMNMNAPSDTKGKDMDNGEKESADPGNAPFELPPGSSRLKTAIYYITLEMTKRPVFICTAMFSFILFIVVVTFATGLGALSEASSYDWIIASTTESKNSDAVEDAMSRVDLLTASGTRMAPYDFPMFFLFNSKNGNDLYNPIDIQRMCNIESIFATNPEYQDFCMLDSNGDCILPTSSVSVFFYGFTNVSEWNCTLLSDSVVDAKKNIFYSVMDTPDGQAQYGLFLDSEADTRGYSIRCNSVWTLGAPLEGYDSATEDTAAQFKKYRMFLTALNGEVGGVEEDLFEEFNIDSNADNFLPYYPSPYMSKASTNNVQVLWFNMMLNQNETERLVGSDLTFAVFSILFVAFWIRVHTGSSFIALFGILMIFLSLPFGLFIYSAVFQIPYYSELHSLVLFIVLGVGADDVFVLVDSWKMTKPHHPGDITNGKNRNIAHRRLNECYRHTVDTVFNTSFTTAMAFVATGMSPLMPISTFGWYAATCIVVNYLFCITLMPPVVVIGEMYCSKPLCTFFPSSTEKPEQQACSAPNQAVQKQHEAIPTSEDVDSGEGLQMVATGESDGVALGMEEGEGGVDGPVSTGAVLVEEEREVVVGGKFVEMYIDSMGFSLKNSGPLTGIPLVAVVIAVSLFVFGVVGVVYGVSLEPPTSQEAWYPSRHMFTMAQKSMANDFLGFDDNSYADLKLTFGISKIDRSGFDIYKPGENRGTAIFDDDYNLATPACQRVMTRMCADLVEYSCTASSCSPTYKLVRSNQTECFMEPFQTYMQTNYGVDPVNLTEAEFYSNLTQFRTTELQTYEAESWQNLIGFIDGTLKFASVTSMLTMENEEPMQNKFRVEGVINDFVAKVKGYEECASNACDCSSLKFSSSYVFSWMRSEMGLVSGFYNGLAFAMPVAACVLLFATGNILISLYAVGSVFFIVFGVLGFANYALGWSLGTAESIAGIIIIGFSVDYTVHLGHMYTVGEYHDLYGRVDKFKFASRKIAATIVGGAITTAGAGVFMFACQLGFFFKMATLIVATILLSYLYSLGFFMAVLYLFGPEGTTGDIYVMGRYVYAVVSGSDKSTLQEIQPAKVEQFDSH